MSDSSNLATNIHRLSSVLGKVADTVVQDSCDFGFSQFKILWVLQSHGVAVSQTTIASWLNLTEAAISRQIGLLLEQGMIIKEVDPNNRRNHLIALTSEGKKCANGAMAALLQEYKPFFAVLSQEEQNELNRMLEKIYNEVINITCKERE